VSLALLTTIYHMLKDGTPFADLGADHFDRRPNALSSSSQSWVSTLSKVFCNLLIWLLCCRPSCLRVRGNSRNA
jgi:hypothetical protein